MEKKQTAVDWLRDKINSNLITPMSPKFEDMFEQAEQMFEEQIKKAVTHGNRQEVYDGTETLGKKYFNETFKK
jgi:hypothetical protein